jgi:hypothetical protein
MFSFKKSILIVSALMLSSPMAFAKGDPSVIDLSSPDAIGFFHWLIRDNPYLHTFEAGEESSFEFKDHRPHYIDRIVINAEGRSSAFGFVKVYADGEEINNLGVPGNDPSYGFRVRGMTREIKLRFDSRIKISAFQIFTHADNYTPYTGIPRDERQAFGLRDYGLAAMNLVNHLLYNIQNDPRFSEDEVSSLTDLYLAPIKRVAIMEEASARARDVRSTDTAKKANALIKAIRNAKALLDDNRLVMTADNQDDQMVLDLETIVQDIANKYDIELN